MTQAVGYELNIVVSHFYTTQNLIIENESITNFEKLLSAKPQP